MKKIAKRSLAILAVMMLLVSTAGLSAFAAVPEAIEGVVTAVQDFDDRTVGTVTGNGDPGAGALIGPQWWLGPYATMEVAQRAEGDNWLKISSTATGEAAATIRMQKNAVWPSSYAADIAPADSTHFMFYVKADANKGLEILPVFFEHNPTSLHYCGGRFAATDASPYTLITKDGAITEVNDTDNYIDIAAGFEGWVLYPLTNADYRYDDSASEADSNTKDKLDPNRILAIELQTKNDTNGAVWYYDDLAMTSDAAAVKEALYVAPPKTDDAPEGLDMYFGQGFGKTEVGDDVNGLKDVLAIQGESDTTNITYAVTENTVGNGNALSMTFNGEAGEFLTTGFTDIGLHFTDRAAITDADALVLRVKTPAATKYAHFDMMIMLTEALVVSGERDYASVGGVFMNRGNFGVNPGSVILVDAATNEYVTNEFGDPYFMPNGFDGWVVLPLSYFKIHPGYINNDNNEGTFDVAEITRMKFQIENAPCGETFVLDSVGLANTEDFLASLDADEKAVDQVITNEVDDVKDVSADTLNYVKDKGVNLVVNVEDGYTLYSWLFEGKNITATDAFNPALITEFDEIEDIQALYEDFEAGFFKAPALPGAGELTIYLGDDFTAPTLYAYADGKVEKLNDVTIDDEGYACLQIAEGGIYFLTDDELKAVGSSDDEKPSDDEQKPTNPDTGYVFPMAMLFVTTVSGAATVLFSKKRS